MANLRTRVQRLEETAHPEELRSVCLVAHVAGEEFCQALKIAKAAHMARYGREPDEYIHLVPLSASD